MIIAFDPGVTTGVAIFHDDEYTGWQLASDNLMSIYDLLWSHANKFNPIVCYEDFHHRQGMVKAELYSVQVIGVIRLWCQQNGITPHFWLPATCKAFWTDAKIKSLGLWLPGKRHAMDALRVLLKYRMENDQEWLERSLQKIRSS